MADLQHVPVLADEVVSVLQPRPGAVFVDGTVGGGGHAHRLLSRLVPGGRLIAIDQDRTALARAQKRLREFGTAVTFVHDNFRNMAPVLAQLGVPSVDGVLLDVGVSSFQLDEAERGFTYRHDAPLDMRMDESASTSAADIVNTSSASELTRIVRDYGEERWAARIAANIVAARAEAPIETTGQLVSVIKRSIPARARHGRGSPHPARRTFQALRIAVNDELRALENGLQAAVDVLAPAGRIAVISFHSLEDRIVKRSFAHLARRCECPPDFPVCRCDKQPLVEVLTRRPIVPQETEVEANPRARSARLRAARRLVLAPKGGEYVDNSIEIS